jgi:hypothetical protein
MTSASIIDYFRRGPVSDASEKVDFSEVNSVSAPLGWIVHPDCCNKSVEAWLRTLTRNHNATFYKEWQDVVSKSRLELLLDQLLHYATTYGELEEGREPEGNGYVPNSDPMPDAFRKMQVLEPISEDELAEKCMEVVKSGIALKERTMKDMTDFWYEKKGSKLSKDDLSNLISEIKNREATVYLSDKAGVLPADEFGMLRTLVFKYSGSPMVIKSRKALQDIKYGTSLFEDERRKAKSPLLSLTDRQLERLSRIFLRFKPIFLAMKTASTASVINKLRRLAAKNHRPMKPGFWENLLSSKATVSEVRDRLPELDPWRKIRIMMLLKSRMARKPEDSMYIIRNGKMFVRKGYAPKYDQDRLSQLYFAFEESLVDSIRNKACTVRFPENYEIALPTSEKNFVGNFPYGTSFRLTSDNIVGVYWRNEWGTRDYDLSMVSIDGGKIGWNAAYYGFGRGYSGDGSKVVYSGDMTNANPEAVELLYIAKSCPDGIVKLNKFNGDDDSKFRFFFANDKFDRSWPKGRMVDPDKIKFDVMVDFQGQGEKSIGVILNDRFTLMDLGTARGRVSVGGKYAENVIEGIKARAEGFVPLKEILLRAGFTVWDPEKAVDPENPEKVVEPGLDLTKLEKDTLIKLFS